MGGPILISQFKRRMRQIILNVEDAAYEQFMGMVALCPQVKVVCDGTACETRDVVDLCVARAIRELQRRNVLLLSSDHTFIMLLSNQGLVDKRLFFNSPLDYIKYLKGLGIDNIPGKSRLYLMMGNTRKQYPEWEFSDCQDTGERLRRNNVARQFLSAFLKERRAIAEGFEEK